MNFIKVSKDIKYDNILNRENKDKILSLIIQDNEGTFLYGKCFEDDREMS